MPMTLEEKAGEIGRPRRVVVLCPGHSLGDERVVARQAVSLARCGYRVSVFGLHDPEKRLPSDPLLRLVGVGAINRTTRPSRVSRLRAVLRARKMAILERPDVVAAHEPESAWAALSVRRHTGARVHFDIHECFEEMAASRVPSVVRPVVRVAVWKGLSALACRCDWLTVVSPHAERQYRALRSDGRVCLLHNSPPIEYFPLAVQCMEGAITVCHEGWLDHSRGMSQLLRAIALARRSARLRLLIVGKVHKACESEFWQSVKTLSIEDIVSVTGWLPYDEVGRVDATAQIGVVAMQPSGNNFGSLSNKLYSYMACGHAAIVPARSSSAEIVSRYNCGLAIDTTDPAAIAEALCLLVRDRELRQQLGSNGRRAIVEELGWHRMEAALLAIYRTLGELGDPDRHLG